MTKMMAMRDVHKSFGSGRTKIEALKGINLEVAAGEFVSIIGPSGSGKSTFLTIAGGLQTPTTGSIQINGQEFNHLKEKQRAKLRFKEIGFILQASNLIPFLTVAEQFNLVDKIEKRKFEKERVEALLTSLDVATLINQYPSDLSGGERQRVAIARALFNNPNLILADEPTASLDTEHAYEVVKILAQEAHDKQKATIMVTHDQRMIQWSDNVYRIKDGELTKV